MEQDVTSLSVSGRSKWLLVGAVFALCVAPTFISYQPYLFSWDDSEYLGQSIDVNRAFWAGSVHGLGAMVSIRPPMMAFMGLPWGRLASWNAAGDCFISLAALTALLAAFCLYLLLRIGVKPFAVLTASVCVLASIGPYPHATPFMTSNLVVMAAAAHLPATGFFADSLFAWTALAAALLIPYETRTSSLSVRAAVLRGLLWGVLLSFGVMTKLNFLYFIVLILPLLLLITYHHSGLRCALAALSGFVLSSAPSTFYLARWGGLAFWNLKASSFGGIAQYYYIPVFQFLTSCIRESPGLLLSVVLTGACLSYLVAKNRISLLWSPDFAALVIMAGFGVIVLAATNKQIRYAFPAIVALPFLTAVLVSGQGASVPRQSAVLAAGLVFSGLVALAVPMRNRPDVQSISRSDAVLAKAAACKAQNIILATNSPTLNTSLVQLAIKMSRPKTPIQVDTLAGQAMNNAPIEQDFHEMSRADQVIFQDRDKLSPPFTNERVAAYEHYVRQLGYVPTKVGGDMNVYSRHCEPRSTGVGSS